MFCLITAGVTAGVLSAIVDYAANIAESTQKNLATAEVRLFAISNLAVLVVYVWFLCLACVVHRSVYAERECASSITIEQVSGEIQAGMEK
ncbi:hypothetical protein NHE_0081 [Neorickettsia helminthoeca str. Oregon]|uniref:Uncharacterized protein n=1 Tax=Neorickettsia helminthoeca str. Oregon TaxID=1286528 RepID=X5GVI9_9RICK|nr:hypothetical protein [Neorickettsia helminthoeca]AHX11052.1 hypothetical protein NHE_0081 [Neorickettsia helminthoeca str. Oregon]